MYILNWAPIKLDCLWIMSDIGASHNKEELIASPTHSSPLPCLFFPYASWNSSHITLFLLIPSPTISFIPPPPHSLLFPTLPFLTLLFPVSVGVIKVEAAAAVVPAPPFSTSLPLPLPSLSPFPSYPSSAADPPMKEACWVCRRRVHWQPTPSVGHRRAPTRQNPPPAGEREGEGDREYGKRVKERKCKGEREEMSKRGRELEKGN